MRTWLTIVGGLVGAVAGFFGTLCLAWVFHPNHLYMWPLSDIEYSLVFGLPLGILLFAPLGRALGTNIEVLRAFKSVDPHTPPGASSVDGQPPRPALDAVVPHWTVPAMVALLLGALAIFPLHFYGGGGRVSPFPLLVSCWFVVPVVLFLGYFVWMWSSCPRAARNEAAVDSREAAARQLLAFGERLGSLSYGFLVPVTIAEYVLGKQFNLAGVMVLAVPGAILVLLAIVAACSFLAGLWTQAFAGRWHAGLTLRNGILFALFLLNFAMCMSLPL